MCIVGYLVLLLPFFNHTCAFCSFIFARAALSENVSIVCSFKALHCQETCALFESEHGIMVLIAYANSGGSGAPVHPHSLTRAFAHI